MLVQMDPFPAGPAGTAEPETRPTAKSPGGRRSEPGRSPAREDEPRRFFRQQRGVLPATTPLSIKTYWRRPLQGYHLGGVGDERSIGQWVKFRLQTIHPNPGPGRNKTEEGKAQRRERRKEKRKEKRRETNNNNSTKYNIITWNVQRMSLGTFNKRKAKTVAEKAKKEGWDAVLLSEVRAEKEGVAWIGEGRDLTAIIFSEKAGILLRGDLLEGWCQKGQPKMLSNRHVSVKTRGLSLTASYIPVYRGNNEEEIEVEFNKLEQHKKWAGKEIFIGGGDFNAHVGGGEEIEGTKGKFGLRESNERGREFIRWCDENNLAYVNSFFNHKNRGTWFNRMLGRWYELDGFIMRKEERHRYARKLNTVGELTLSDHKPKKLQILVKKWHWPTNKRARVPKIRWERLKDQEIAQQYRQRIDELIEENERENRQEEMPDRTNYKEIIDLVTRAAKDVCGEEEKRIENPWMVGKEEELQRMKSRISGAVARRNAISERARTLGEDLERETAEAKENLKDARREMKREIRRYEREWWEEKIAECVQAEGRGDQGKMYKLMKELGRRGWKGNTDATTITKEEFRDHFKGVSENRFENTPEEIEEAVNEIDETMFNTDEAELWNDMLEETPQREEIIKEMKKMRDSAPGRDGVRLGMLLKGGEEIINRVVTLVQYMFNNGPDKWEDELKIGLVIPLHKKGDRNRRDNYRGVCLLAMGSRILARIMANRLRIWAEKLEILDDDQAGFRKERSTADATQVMVRIQEDVTDLRRRREARGQILEDSQIPVARLLDLRKAYPRVNKPALWGILQKYGMKEKALRVLKGLHEATEYRVKSREGESEPWVPARGLREGDPSSPVLFNVFHQVVMRVGTKVRKRKAEEAGLEMGVSYKVVPGSFFPGGNTWEKQNSEAKRVKIDKELFADDTSVIGKKNEIELGLRTIKEVMNRFEEKNNDDKEEEVIFGTEDSNKIRMLGSWLGPAEDIKQRKKRAGAAWVKVKTQLKGSRLSKRSQAKIVQACAESAMLFDCQVRTWQAGEIKKLQSCVDKMYRYIWSSKVKPPLIQMQEMGVNMQDIRTELGIGSIRVKIEKRCLERLGHLMRMDDNRLVKCVTLGWLEDLENEPKVPGKKRKTVLFYKKLVREAGLDYTKIGAMTRDRKEWKKCVKKRIKHLYDWDKKKGKKSQGPTTNRNQELRVELVNKCDECGKICKSRGGLMTHIKRTHEISNQKVTFTCDICNQVFQYESSIMNHKKNCQGTTTESRNLRKCSLCLKTITTANFARHQRTCRARNNQEPQPVRVEGTARVYKSRNKPCSICGKILSATNMARHQTKCIQAREAEL